MKKFCKSMAGLLICAVSLFEINELSRFISLASDGNTAYLSDIFMKALFMLSIIGAGILIMANKVNSSAFLLIFAGSITIYKAFVYVRSIIGNEMIFGIVLGNIIDIIELSLFVAPAAIVLLSSFRITGKALRGGFIATASAFVIGIAGRIITFVSWGKSFASDFALLFSAYGTDMFRTFVMGCTFALLLLGFMPEKIKKRK